MTTPTSYAGRVMAAHRTLQASLLAGAVFVLTSLLLPQAAHAAPASAARSADAIECEQLDIANAAAVRDKAEAVTDVFAGKVRSAQALMADGGRTGRAGQEDRPRTPSDWQHVVQVTAPFRTGLLPGDRVQVLTHPVADNGLGKLEVGATYLFFVTTEQGMDRFEAEPCSGTHLLRDGLSAQQQSALKEALSDAPDDAMPEVALTEPSDGTHTVPAWGRLAAPGAAVALIGVLGLMLLARVGSRRA